MSDPEVASLPTTGDAENQLVPDLMLANRLLDVREVCNGLTVHLDEAVPAENTALSKLTAAPGKRDRQSKLAVCRRFSFEPGTR